MKPFCLYTCLLLTIAVLCVLSAPVLAQPPDSPLGAVKSADGSGESVMTRGPIHEAFAQPVNTGAVRPLVVPKPPPEPIREEPPAARPADGNALWLRGYWSWDDDRGDFLWVSGTWRVPPPGHRWISGYWTPVSGGYQWTSGLWYPETSEEVAYYPPPPETTEQGPPSDPPSADDFWIPGCWQWSDAGYVWRPGHWAPAQPGWVWVPNSYFWSPRGWVFRDGYWDYPLTRRGLFFAPVHFAATVYSRPGFFYSPSVAIDPLALSFHLFVRPSHGHYYFGDYYAARYDGLGIFPWFSVFRHGRYAYDPIFSYYSWYYRGRDPRWMHNLQGWHDHYRAHADRRPAHTLAAQHTLVARAGDRSDRAYLALAHPVKDWQGRSDAPVRLTTVAPAEKARIAETARRVREIQSQRARLETRAAAGVAATPGAPSQRDPASSPKTPQRMSLSQLPVIGASEAGTPRVAARPGETRPGTPERAKIEREGERGEQRRPGITPPKTAPDRLPTPGPGVTPRRVPEAQPAAPSRPEEQRGRGSAGPPRTPAVPPGGVRKGPESRETPKPVVPKPEPRRRDVPSDEIRRPPPPPPPPRAEKRAPAPPQGPPAAKERDHPTRQGDEARGKRGAGSAKK